MNITGYIQSCNDGVLTVVAEFNKPWLLDKKYITDCEIRLSDGRTIRAEQRRKAYAILGDIVEYTGEPLEYVKEIQKAYFIERYGVDYFSLSDCSVDTAREFISYLIDFCFEQNIGTRDTMLNRTDDIGRYLYSCLANRKCAVCNAKAEIHHCNGSRVGMGFNRNDIHNVGRSAIALCRKHHNQAHNSERDFFNKYLIYGIKLDEYLVKKLKL